MPAERARGKGLNRDTGLTLEPLNAELRRTPHELLRLASLRRAIFASLYGHVAAIATASSSQSMPRG